MRNGKRVSSCCLSKSGSSLRFRTDCILGKVGPGRQLDSGKLGGEGRKTRTTTAPAQPYRSGGGAGTSPRRVFCMLALAKAPSWPSFSPPPPIARPSSSSARCRRPRPNLDPLNSGHVPRTFLPRRMKAKPYGFVVIAAPPDRSLACWGSSWPGPIWVSGGGWDSGGPGPAGCPVTAGRVMSHSSVTREAP